MDRKKSLPSDNPHLLLLAESIILYVSACNIVFTLLPKFLFLTKQKILSIAFLFVHSPEIISPGEYWQVSGLFMCQTI